jgi:hypothetical protein
MSISIYSKYQIDVWTHLKEVCVLSDDDSVNHFQSSSSQWFQKNLYSNSTDVCWDDWSEIHSILFDSYDGDKSSFNMDSRGFIPPHILKSILNSKYFKEKYESFKRDFDEQLDLAMNYEFGVEDDEEEYCEKPDEDLLEKSSRILIILDTIIKLSDEGISYS